MADTAKLYELQKTDSNWEKVKRRLLQIQKLMGESEEVRTARQQSAAAEDVLQQWQAKQKNAELESQSLLGKISGSEQRLMSGQVRNSKELESLQSSIEALKRQRTTVDGEGVEAMMQVETVQKQFLQAQKALAQVEAKWREKQGELVEEENKLKRMFLQLKTHRAKLTGSLPPADLEQYEDLRRRKNGIAVTQIDKGLCTACNMKVPTGVVSTSHNNSQVSYCPSCGRILVSG